MDECIDLLDEIYRIKADSELLITSFKYNQYFFEKHIFTHFKNKTFPILLIDYNEYQNNVLEFYKSRYAEIKYLIEPVKVPGCFHPKIFLSVSDDEVVLFIGSNNLTPQGYLSNLESIITVRINFKCSEDVYLLRDIKEVLTHIKELVSSETHKKRIDKIIKKIPEFSDSKKRDSWILSNIKKDLFSQIKHIINEDIEAITVICPYFSQNKKFYEDVLSFTKKLEIIIQSKTNDLPKEELRDLDIIYKEIKIPNNRFLHSKLIIFRTKDFEYLLSGSANFSSSALRQPSRNGNVEICVLSKLKKGTSNDLIKEVGIIKPIKLDKIKSCVPEEFDQKSRSEFQYRILEALIKGNEIVVKLDKDIKTNEIKLVSGDIEKEYTTKANGKTVVFSIPREDLYLFDNVSALKLKIGNEQSDYKLLYNPSFFPEQYSMLNSLVSDNVDWLFALLNKLSRIPNFSQYTPILDKLDKYGAFDTGADREKILLKLRNKLALVNPYSHTEKIKEVIQRFIIRHKKRVSNAIKYNEYKNAKQVISSFLMINKLILWAVENNYDNIDGLRHIRGNMENFCGEYKKGYLSIMADNDLIELLIDSDLFYHCLLLVFIIDLLQFFRNYNPKA